MMKTKVTKSKPEDILDLPKIGDMFFSEKSKVMMSMIELDKKNKLMLFRIADSDYVMNGPIGTWHLMKQEMQFRQIDQAEWDEKLVTYREEIRKHTEYMLKQQIKKCTTYEKCLVYYNKFKDRPTPNFQLPMSAPVVVDFSEDSVAGVAHNFTLEDDRMFCDISLTKNSSKQNIKMIPSLGIEMSPESIADQDISAEAYIVCVGLTMDNSQLDELKSINCYSIAPVVE